MKALPALLERVSSKYTIIEWSSIRTTELESFFAIQPKNYFEFFTPHGFDAKSLRKLQRNKAFLAYIVKDNDTIVGYFFLRSFFIGKAFFGKMVDNAHQGQGIAKMMCLCAMDIALTLRIRMFGTISKDNLASLYSTQNVLVTRVVKEMPDNYLMIEDLKRKE